jgi:cytochrome c oxidase subunit II
MSPPVEASSFARSVDLLFDAMLALSVVVALGVAVTITWFGVRYRHGNAVDRSNPPRRRLGVELAWTLIPLALFIAIFVWSIRLWVRLRTPPSDASPIYVIARQWMWKVQHPGGQREINALHVPLGRPIRLIMTSDDVIHSFFVPAFRVKEDVLPGRYTDLWFEATRVGTYQLLCAEFCGTDHSRMGGWVTVMKDADYARWLDAHASTGLASRGADLFRRYGCSGCHGASSSVHAPDLVGIYGRSVPLADGSTVTADDRYLHDSIMLPAKQVAAGYAPVMPSFEGRIGEDDVLALIAYLKSPLAAKDEHHDAE